MFWLNLSFSWAISSSFFLVAPGLLFRLLCFILAFPIAFPSLSSLAISGKAFSKDWRFVIRFFGRGLLFLAIVLGFSTLERRAERFIMRLSFLERPKALLDSRIRSLDGWAVFDFGIGLDDEYLTIVGA